MNKQAASKLALSVRLARECRRDAWQVADARERREYRRISRESMQDARYWRAQLVKA